MCSKIQGTEKFWDTELRDVVCFFACLRDSSRAANRQGENFRQFAGTKLSL